MKEKEKNKLSAKEVAELLGSSLVTVQRWAYQGKIPCKLKKDGYVFKRKEIIEWAQAHDFLISQEKARKSDTQSFMRASFYLTEAIKRGGIFYDLAGGDIYSVLKEAVQRLSFISDDDKGMVLDELLNREEIASTGIGKGVAIPHPRRTLDLSSEDPVIPVFFLEQPVDFNAVDGQDVKVLFIMFSPSTQIHLKLLSKLSVCLRSKEFQTLLDSIPEPDTLLEGVRLIESSLDNKDKD